MLKKCPYCGKEISDKSDSCIHCGAKFDNSNSASSKSNSKDRQIILIAAIFVVFVAIVGFLFLKNDDKKKNIEEMSHHDVPIITEEFAKRVNEFDTITSAHFSDFSIAFFCGDSTNPVACVGKSGLYGLINLKGDIVIPFTYESPIEPMNDNKNVAVVKKAGKFGVLNLYDFSEVVACSFDNDWSDITVAIKNECLWLKKNGKYGLCDNKGKMLTDFIYSDKLYGPSESNEVCPVCKNGRWGFITKNGKEISSTFVYKGIFAADDVGCFRGEYKEDEDVVLDSIGTIIPEIEYDNWRFKHGKKRVYDVVGEKYGCKGGKYGYKGNWFKEGLALVNEGDMFEGGKSGFIDEQGHVVVPLEYDLIDCGGFCNGVAVVCKHGDYGVVNAKGEEVLPCEYEEKGIFVYPANGGIRVMKNNKYGLWQKDKGMVVPCQYDYVHGFCDGMANVWVKDGDGYVGGYVDLNGKVVIPIIYEFASDFSYGLAIVGKNGKVGFIDKTGRTTFQD
ncbi:MAG: WG repeat-containing protein [Bacteroidales bacterium]|nr:WG repeat-containing protein [Bacteroidales bacterium]